MSSKKRLIIIGFFLILLIVLSMIYVFLPKIEIDIKGAKTINLLIGEEYKEEGAEAHLKKIAGTKPLKVKITGKVDANKIGKYIITYTSLTKHLKKEKIRIINVIDNVKPEIISKKEVIGCKKNNLIEYEIEAYDNYDGDISKNVKYNIKNDEIIFSVHDSSNNQNKLIKNIKFVDEEKPKITLNNEKNIYLTIGTTYEEYGATAYDSCDGNLTSQIKIEHNIDINKVGIYEVNYIVSDSNNKKSIEKRYVTVTEEQNINNEYKVVNGATIYLTFDDGPGPYTEELLNILDEYNIKATFFVTGQFPNYQYLIGEEYKRGHTIGIHTYTHKWNIYENVESYLNDFNQIDNIVFQETGTHSKIFRFPGGSSNRVSANYSKGIMSQLANIMQEKGYTYYDWTFDSGDTNKKDNSVNVILKNFKTYLKGDGEYIVLMHDIKKNTISAMPEIIKYAKSNGYEFDKINENTPIPHFKIFN